MDKRKFEKTIFLIANDKKKFKTWTDLIEQEQTSLNNQLTSQSQLNPNTSQTSEFPESYLNLQKELFNFSIFLQNLTIQIYDQKEEDSQPDFMV